MIDSDTPPEVMSFSRDFDELGQVNSDGVWNVSHAWQARFQRHRDALIPLAEGGNTAAQYALSGLYMLGLLYTSEEAAAAAYPADVLLMSRWLELAAASGHLAAIDNLMTSGVGDAAERLRSIYHDNPERFRNCPPPSAEWEDEMRDLYCLAYGTASGSRLA